MSATVAAAIKQRQSTGSTTPRLNGRGYDVFESFWVHSSMLASTRIDGVASLQGPRNACISRVALGVSPRAVRMVRAGRPNRRARRMCSPDRRIDRPFLECRGTCPADLYSRRKAAPTVGCLIFFCWLYALYRRPRVAGRSAASVPEARLNWAAGVSSVGFSAMVRFSARRIEFE